MVPYCQAAGVGIIPWSPLASGVLAHPWDDRSDVREQKDVFLGLFFRNGKSDEANKAIVDKVEEIAKSKGVAMAQVATAWVLSKGACPVMGLESVERIDQAVAAVKVKLSEEEVAALEAPYVPKVPFAF